MSSHYYVPCTADAVVREAAARQRRQLRAVLLSAQASDGLMFDSLKTRKESSVWVTSQSLIGIFHSPDLSAQEAQVFIKNLEAPFKPDSFLEKNGAVYAWSPPGGELNPAMPALWTAGALAAALGKPGMLDEQKRDAALHHLGQVQRVAGAYRPTDDGGWNMFPNQIDPAQHQVYPTALALLVLLETREAGLPWEGSADRRDALLRSTVQWLISQYDDKAQPPGWHDASGSTYETFDGLTLMTFSLLLRAESVIGIVIPSHILNRIPQHLSECVTRDLNFPMGTASYGTRVKDLNNREYVAKQSIGFLWHSWAVDCAVRWLKRSESHAEPKETVVRVQRRSWSPGG